MLPSTFFHPVSTRDFKLQAILTTVAINYYILLQYESRHLVAEFTKMVGGKCIRPWVAESLKDNISSSNFRQKLFAGPYSVSRKFSQ